MTVLTHDETQTALDANNPPIEVGQRWVIRDDTTGEVVRAFRILGKHPDGGWMHDDDPAVPTRSGYWSHGREITVIPEYNLRRICKLERVDG